VVHGQGKVRVNIMEEQFEYIVITISSHTTDQLNEFDTQAINFKQFSRWNRELTKYILKCPTKTPLCFKNHTRYTKSELQEDILTLDEWNGYATYNTGSSL
tara:strand:- start:732 stop:1034 length:303 start_codon:yes stop_codon:yes gene_type:complete